MPRLNFAACFLALATLSQPLAAQTNPPVYSQSLVQQALQGLLPSGAYVSKFTVEGERVKLEGSAGNNTQVSDFMRKIETSEDFQAVELEEISSANSGVNFVMHAKIACSATPKATDRVLCGRAPPKAQAIYKCRIDGSVSFQNKPCPAGTEL